MHTMYIVHLYRVLCSSFEYLSSLLFCHKCLQQSSLCRRDRVFHDKIRGEKERKKKHRGEKAEDRTDLASLYLRFCAVVSNFHCTNRKPLLPIVQDRIFFHCEANLYAPFPLSEDEYHICFSISCIVRHIMHEQCLHCGLGNVGT